VVRGGAGHGRDACVFDDARIAMGFGSIELVPGMKGGGGGAADVASSQRSGSLLGGNFAWVFETKLRDEMFAAEKARWDEAEKVAGDLVANALILPMLKQLRRSPWGENSVFSGGIGEKTFGPEFDRQIAERLAQSPKMGIKTALAKRLTNKTELDVHG